MMTATPSQQVFWPYYIAGASHTISAGLVILLAAALLLGTRIALVSVSHRWLAFTCAVSGVVVCYAYVMEFFMAYYSANPFELQTFKMRAIDGPSAWFYYGVLAVNFATLLLWFPRMRKPLPSLLICIVSLSGVAYELIVTAINRRGA